MGDFRWRTCALAVLVLAAVSSRARGAGEPGGAAEASGRLRALVIDGGLLAEKPFIYLDVGGRPTRVRALGADTEGVTVSAAGMEVRLAWERIPPAQLASLAAKLARTARDHLLVARYCALHGLRERMEEESRKALELDPGLEEEIRLLLSSLAPKAPEEPQPTPEEATSEEAGKTAPTITLVANGRPNAVIVVSKNDVEQACAKELQLYLARISGAAIPIANKAPGKTRKSVIFVANNRRVSGFKLGTRGLVGSGFRIATAGENVMLLGRDDKGTESSVRCFLEKYCGVRWHMPGELRSPRKRTLRVERKHVEMGAVSAHGATYFVAKHGRDSNPGTGAEPWQTIQKAAGRLKAGDTVYVMEGTYNERVIPKNSGSPGKYITYSAYPGHTVTIDGTGISFNWAGLFHLRERSFIRISGMRIINSAYFGIDVTGNTQHIVLERNYIYKCQSSGIHVWSGDKGRWTITNVVIDGNEISETNINGSQEGISMCGVDTFVIRNNNEHHCHKEGIDAKDGCSNGKIHDNYVHDHNPWFNIHTGTRRGPGLGIYVDTYGHTHNIDVFRNVVHDTGSGIVLSTESGEPLENIRVYNNIVHHVRYYGIEITKWSRTGKNPMNNIRVTNNTVYKNRVGIRNTNPDATNLLLRNNICSQNGTQITAKAGNTVDHNLIDGRTQIAGDNAITGNPKFVDPSEGDFHLRSDSPAIDKGSSVDAPSVDFDGNPRPRGTGYDIGAYEYQ